MNSSNRSGDDKSNRSVRSVRSCIGCTEHPTCEITLQGYQHNALRCHRCAHLDRQKRQRLGDRRRYAAGKAAGEGIANSGFGEKLSGLNEGENAPFRILEEKPNENTVANSSNSSVVSTAFHNWVK